VWREREREGERERERDREREREGRAVGDHVKNKRANSEPKIEITLVTYGKVRYAAALMFRGRVLPQMAAIFRR